MAPITLFLSRPLSVACSDEYFFSKALRKAAKSWSKYVIWSNVHYLQTFVASVKILEAFGILLMNMISILVWDVNLSETPQKLIC